MIIGVNARLLLKNKLEGIGWFAHELLKRMVKSHPEHQFVFFFDRPYDDSFIFGSNVKPVILKPQARHPVLYWIWTKYALPKALKKHEVDVYFSPDFLGLHSSKIPSIITLHDLAFLHYPDFIDRAHKWYLKNYTPFYAKHTRKIITVSEFSKSDILANYDFIPEDHIKVIYNAANKAFKPLSWSEQEAIKKEFTDGQEFYLFTSAIHPRKNVINLLKAFVKFKRRQQNNFKLVIIGRMAWQSEEIEVAKKRMPFKEDVIWLDYQPIETVAKLTASAWATIYPSLFEGFGIPIVESYACHKPVITSNTSSMPEVAGEGGLTIDPNDVDDLAEHMMELYRNEKLHQFLTEKAKEITKIYNWDNSAQQLMKVIEGVYEDNLNTKK
ncbi:MAG TPA: glycosyltransferase family 1 protein [Chitinophagaceae bacterium]|nr:glycosyltransferase family 1 protein [Chitinophagaceae bacterium]